MDQLKQQLEILKDDLDSLSTLKEMLDSKTLTSQLDKLQEYSDENMNSMDAFYFLENFGEILKRELIDADTRKKEFEKKKLPLPEKLYTWWQHCMAARENMRQVERHYLISSAPANLTALKCLSVTYEKNINNTSNFILNFPRLKAHIARLLDEQPAHLSYFFVSDTTYRNLQIMERDIVLAIDHILQSPKTMHEGSKIHQQSARFWLVHLFQALFEIRLTYERRKLRDIFEQKPKQKMSATQFYESIFNSDIFAEERKKLKEEILQQVREMYPMDKPLDDTEGSVTLP